MSLPTYRSVFAQCSSYPQGLSTLVTSFTLAPMSRRPSGLLPSRVGSPRRCAAVIPRRTLRGSRGQPEFVDDAFDFRGCRGAERAPCHLGGVADAHAAHDL